MELIHRICTQDPIVPLALPNSNRPKKKLMKALHNVAGEEEYVVSFFAFR